MTALYQALLGWLPAYIQYIILGFIAIMIVFLIVRIVIWVLESLPFL